MKQLALGFQPMPRGAKNYLDVIDATIDQGPPDELLLRLWFTSSARSVRSDADRTIFEIAGTPIRLSGQNERAMANGRRGNLTRDFRTEAFVGEFNKHWHAIRSEYPVYGALESIYRAASIAQLLHRYADAPAQKALMQALAGDQLDSAYPLPTPRRVESIARMHSVRKGRKVHHVLLASGGVAVDSRQTLTANLAEYPSLRALPKPSVSRPVVIQRWWWDAN